MLVTVEGIVIGRRSVGETSCFIDVLTDEYGVIEATAHGVKKLTSKNAGSTALFTYSKFCFSKTGTRYTLNSAEPKYNFLGISGDIEYLSLAAYFADVMKYSSASEQEAEGHLRFMAITLYELDKKRRPPELIKAVFEMYVSVLLGFAPDLRACRECADYESDKMYFDYDDPGIICGDCIKEQTVSGSDIIPITADILYALRYIVYSPVDRIYKLEAGADVISELSGITEKYLLKQLDRSFKSLDYYKSIKL